MFKLLNYELTGDQLEFLVTMLPYQPTQLPAPVSHLFHEGLIERNERLWIATRRGLEVKQAWALRTGNTAEFHRLGKVINDYR